MHGTLDALLSSPITWGFVGLILAAIALSGRLSVTAANLLLVAAWVLGCYGFYRSDVARDLRLILAFSLSLGACLSLLAYWMKPGTAPSSAPMTQTVKSAHEAAAAQPAGSPQPTPVVKGAAQPFAEAPKPTSPGMRLIFKDSPLLNEGVRERIRGDLGRFRDYFVTLDIPVPAELPAIGVDKSRTGTSTRWMYPLPTYRADMMIGDKSIDNPMEITLAYSNYVLDQLLVQRRPQHPSVDTMQDIRAFGALSTYFNWSFWDKKPKLQGERWATPLWEIRQKFGKAFTDRMLAYTLKALVDTPEEEANADFDIYFYRKIKTGDSIVDNGGEKLSEITEIVERSGISVTKPKAELSFNATALRAPNGNLLVKVDVVNNTRVPANNGQFRLQLIPDGRFANEPEGSLKDPSTTMESVRLFTFDSIPPQAGRTVNLEVVPVLDPRDKTFSLIFSYKCETCADDYRLHQLKFNIAR